MFWFHPLLHSEEHNKEFIMLMMSPAVVTLSIIESNLRVAELILWSPNVLAGPKTT